MSGKNQNRTKIIDLSDQSREILRQVFINDPSKLVLINKTIGVVLRTFDKNKINKYSVEIRKNIIIEKGDDVEYMVGIDILNTIRIILQDLYLHYEINKESLSKLDRKFIQNNIDIIAQVIIVLAIDIIPENELFDQEVLLKILIFVRATSVLDVDMSVRKYFGLCWRKN